MTVDDALYRFRLRVFAVAHEMGSVRAACRIMGIHPSTYYRWRRQLLRFGPEILRPRERRLPRMANATSPLVEQRVVAFALGQPGFGPARISAELRRPKWVGSSLPQRRALVEVPTEEGGPFTYSRAVPVGPGSRAARFVSYAIPTSRWTRRYVP